MHTIQVNSFELPVAYHHGDFFIGTGTMNRIRIDHTEQGRSLTEMLGVLTVIGILTIGAVAGYRYAVDKTQANTIARDARMTYTLLHGKNNLSEDDFDAWLELNEFAPDFTPACGKVITALRNDNGDYVKVDEIAKGVCNRLLDMRGNQIEFYDENGLLFKDCIDENTIVFGFNGVSFGDRCENGAECVDGAYCHEQGICTFCEEGTIPNKAQTQCITPCAEEENTCETDTDYWCCSADTVCDYENKTCAKSDGLCSAYIDNQLSELQFTTDCAATMTNNPSEMKYSTNCQMQIEIGDISQVVGDKPIRNNTFKWVKECPAGAYCSLQWSQSEWTGITPPTASDNATNIYGVCANLATNNPAANPEITVSKAPLQFTKACPAGAYCSLQWSQSEWMGITPPVASDTATNIYGVCANLTTNNPAAKLNIDSFHESIQMNKGCQKGNYCNIKYENQQCTAVTDASKGNVYGICLEMKILSSSGLICPYQN